MIMAYSCLLLSTVVHTWKPSPASFFNLGIFVTVYTLFYLMHFVKCMIAVN